SDQIVFFVVERRAAQVSNRRGLHQGLTTTRFLKRSVSALPQAVGDHVYRLIEVQVFPLMRERPPVFDFVQALGVGQQFKARRAVRAEAATGNRRLGIAFNRDKFPVTMKNLLATADCTIRTDRPGNLRSFILGPERLCLTTHSFRAGAIAAFENLPDDRPSRYEI